VRGEAEDLLDVPPHVEVLEDPVALVHDEVLDLVELEGFLAGEGEDAAGGSDDDVGRVILEDGAVELDVDYDERSESRKGGWDDG